MCEKLDETNSLKNNLTIRFKESYNLLLYYIKKYKFKENSPKGYAVKENKNSKIILEDLKVLTVIINETLKQIDTYIETHPENEVINNSLIAYTELMYETYDKLYISMSKYYTLKATDPQINSGKRARIWKKERNNALATIINVASVISVLGDMVKPEEYTPDAINNFQIFINYLSKAQNYYCYLPQEEKQEIIRKLKKEE